MATEVAEARVLPTGTSTIESTEKNTFYVEVLSSPPRVPRIVGHMRSVTLPATPTEVLLGDLHHPSLRLRVPMSLTVVREDGVVTVWSPDVDELGYGPNLGVALEDFQIALGELYLSLRDQRENLGADLQRVLGKLDELIQDRA